MSVSSWVVRRINSQVWKELSIKMFLIRLELSLQPTVPWPPLKTSSICPNTKNHMFSWAVIFVPHIESEGQTVQTVRTTVIAVSVGQTYRLCTVPAWTMESAVITHSVKVGAFWRQHKLLKKSQWFKSPTGTQQLLSLWRIFQKLLRTFCVVCDNEGNVVLLCYLG